MQPELATLAKNGEKPFFTIWTFFDCYVFILVNYCVLEAFSKYKSVVVE
ncbi:hypothetical protein T4C_12491 [Trichinella pseudospiralis]|uniref:Uncharacterized protein n=1 Tax=Trichinella pseudospiralis TaxID=6337 RepID=A0A0V1GIJ7_TRIPS|nr:hypothetical protein T4C_12491 [Trichinella pseudospiralis]